MKIFMFLEIFKSYLTLPFTVSHRSICSGSSTPSSQDSKTTRESSKIISQTGLSVVKITFPEKTKKTALKKTSKT